MIPRPLELSLAALLLGAGCRDEDGSAVEAELVVSELLGRSGDQDRAFARATEARAFAFPADHGPHPEFRNEWWYATGNLTSSAGARLGFELTIFRTRLPPGPVPPDERPSAWATDQVYMAHFAVTDAARGEFFARERFARGALGLAGARAEPFSVWLEDWSMRSRGPDMFPLHLAAATDVVAVDLVLDEAKALVLQGDRGLSPKGPEPGNASYYYSYTRLDAEGTVTTPTQTHRARGTAWIDREWSTSALGVDEVGWDWFALQLDGERELMLYQLRRRDGSASPFSAATFVGAGGEITKLAGDDFTLEVLDHWTSPDSGIRYPSRWVVRIPALAARLEIEPVLADQELDLAVRYWEGSVDVEGVLGGEPAAGVGYAELAGYGGGVHRSASGSR